MSFKVVSEDSSEQMVPKLTIKLIGHYSIDGDSKYHADLSQLKYYVPPPDFDNVSFNLNKDSTATRYKPTSYIKLDDILTWISDNFNLLEKPLSQEGQWLDTDFICRRGALKTILCTPYEKYENWIIYASKYRGTIYLCEFYTHEKEQRHVNASTQERRLSSWGYKFEQYMVADQPTHKPDISVPLNECEKFHCVIKANFDHYSLLYEAEIDGISSEQPITDTLTDKTIELIELKTFPLKFYNEIGTEQNKKYGTIPIKKAITWWSQNYLAGIERLICGLKNRFGKVIKIKEHSTQNLPELSKPRCNINSCKLYLKLFLDNLKKIVIKDYNECMYKFYYDAPNNVVKYSEEASNDEMYLFLKPEFIKKAENYNNTFQ
ncbi:decapping and exoribonuclease protein-like [Cataglyphis hispanica]|uniref:decapping and exoribonuclease protein-like n=1 Tax=Cataglyphis hispanica TaxID=1086592 RepID=UPI00217F7C70|nr:decapping and exoribonuclease protein-like [Cataglyphis hispanica]